MRHPYCYTLALSHRADAEPLHSLAVSMIPIYDRDTAHYVRAHGGLLFPHDMPEVAIALNLRDPLSMMPAAPGTFSAQVVEGRRIYQPKGHDDPALQHCLYGDLPHHVTVSRD